MKLRAFTIALTDDCNFNCSYCVQQRSSYYLDLKSIEDALTFFFPYFEDDYSINFYGGEPLLAFDQIQSTVDFLSRKRGSSRKKARYSIITNGSLLSDKVIEFLDEHSFTLVLSFDGLAQNSQRNSGSFPRILNVLGKLLKCSGIDLEVNAVFAPDTIQHLSASVKLLLDLNVPSIRYSLSYNNLWSEDSIIVFEKELKEICEYFLTPSREHRKSQIANFKDLERHEISFCSAGQDRISISAQGEIWGCPIFPTYFNYVATGEEEASNYRFGTLKEIKDNYHEIRCEISSNYAQLRMDNCSTSKIECFLCSNIEHCSVCPVISSLTGTPLNIIPEYICRIQKIKSKMLSYYFGGEACI